MGFEIKKWKELKPETARFIIDQAEKNLIETIRTADSLLKRSLSILLIVIPLIISFFSFAVSQIQSRNFYGLLVHLALLSLIPLGKILLITLEGYNLYDVKPPGNTPQNMIREGKKGNLSDPKQNLIFYVERIESLQRCLEINKAGNKERAENLRKIFVVLQKSFWGGVIYTVIYLLGFLILLLSQSQGQFVFPCP